MPRSGLRRGVALVLFGLVIQNCNCRLGKGQLSQLVAVPGDAGVDGGPSLPNLDVSPRALSFGPTVVHSQVSLPITLTNLGGSSVTLTFSAMQGTDASIFTLGTPGGMTLGAGMVASLNVTYAPISVTSAASSASFTISECAGCEVLPISLTGQPVATGLSITPDPLDFGFLPPGQSVTQRIQLSNIANEPVQVTKLALSPGSPATAFALGANAPSLPLTLAPGKSRGVPITFTPPPGSLAVYTGKLSVSSTDPGAPQVTVPITGTGGGPQIQCVPASISFGQAVVGVPTTQQIVCTNVGQDVPGDPASTLQVGSLTVPDDAAFTAQFDSPPPAAGLTSGENVVIDVVYTPPLAQVDVGHLHVASNDTQLPDDVIPLSGTAIVLPPCDSILAPAGGLVFGEVGQGLSLQLPFAITNNGVGDCLVENLNLSPSTNAAFTLPNGPIASQILGYPGNAQGTPTSLTVPVQFAPTAAGNFNGTVQFTISNPVNPQITVPLSGESGTSCLVINPSSLNFGTVNVNPTTNAWCASLARNVELINTCTSDIHVTSISVGVGTGLNPEFVLSGQPASYPATIPGSGTPVTVQVAFQPDSQGVKNGTLAVMIEEQPQGPYLVPLTGDAEPNGQETDTFTVTDNPPQVDLLFVLDNDDDSDQYPNFAKNAIPAIFAAMPTGMDFHMAVTDDDTCSAAGADNGYFEPCANCQYTTNPADGSATTVFTSQNPNAQNEVAGLIPHPNWNCGSSGISDEHMFDGFYLPLQPAMLAPGGPNAGFLRPNAYLAILEIDDDSEDDLSTSLNSVQAYYDFLVGVKGDASLVSYSYVNQGLSSIPGGNNAKVSQLVQMSGGVESDMSTANWISDLTGLWTAAAGLDQTFFPLNGQPVASSIVVTINGVAMPATSATGSTQWTLNAVNNSIDFAAGSAPMAGQTVAVTYTTACN